MTEVEIHTDTIRLDQFLKLAGAVPSGGIVKELIAAEAILRNGEVETARRRKLIVGDVITIKGDDIYHVSRS